MILPYKQGPVTIVAIKDNPLGQGRLKLARSFSKQAQWLTVLSDQYLPACLS